MRFGWVAVVAVVLAGCGSTGGEADDDLPEPPTASVTPLPKFDAATKNQAKQLLDTALQSLIADGSVTFRSTVVLFGATLTGVGGVDIDDEASQSEMKVSGRQLDDIGGEASFEYRIRKTHVYGSPTFGPFDKCWFDYGRSNPLFADDPAPWLHMAVAAVTDAEAIGLAEGSKNAVVVEVPASELLAVTSSKLVNLVADQLSEDDPILARAVVELKEGRYSTLRFNVNEAFAALEQDGVDITAALQAGLEDKDVDAPVEDVDAMLKAYFSSTQTVEYEPGVPVSVEVPPDDELMDASDITDPENLPDKKPELCAAAG